MPAVLVAVAGATALSAILDLASKGVATVGTLPQGVPTPKLPWTELNDVGPLFVAAVGITLVSLTDTIATASSFAARRGDEVEPNQEMIGMGAANVAAGFVQGFAVSTSGSRTAVAEQSGAKTQLTGLVGAGVVVILLLFLNSLLADLPQSALAAVVIAAALSLMDVSLLAEVRAGPAQCGRAVTHHQRRRDRVRCAPRDRDRDRALGASSSSNGRWWAHGAVLGQVPGVGGWHSVELHPDASELDGIVVYRWEAPLHFANAGAFRRQIRHLVRERQPVWVVLQCEAITDIDVTAAGMLEQLDRELNERGTHMAFVEMRTRLQTLTLQYGLFETLDRDHFYPTVRSAIEAIEAEGD